MKMDMEMGLNMIWVLLKGGREGRDQDVQIAHNTC